MVRRCRAAGLLCAALAVGAIAPAAAQATEVFSGQRHTEVKATPGEDNNITVTYTDTSVTIKDTTGRVAIGTRDPQDAAGDPPKPCTRPADDQVHTLTCTMDPAASEALYFELGDGDDNGTIVDPGKRASRTYLFDGPGDDTFRSANSTNHWFPGPGNDVYRCGKGADDFLVGDTFNAPDEVNVPGDRISGGGNDKLFGSDGRDILAGGLGKDFLDGGKGNDRLFGNQQNDQEYGGPGNDLVDGGDGNDRLFGQLGVDRLLGARGNDFLSGGPGLDSLNGGSGSNTLQQ
jgi:Ca2+-binding RTX toxin-like protein